MGASDSWPEIYSIRRNSNGTLAAYAPPTEFGSPPWELELQMPAYRRIVERSGDAVPFTR
jgi:hypothetical protein